MTRTERKLVRITGLMGLVLTCLVVALDQAGVLVPLEHLLYDRRARYCQLNVPPSTDTLCHLDIDDAACETLGRWPWRREEMAQIVDELRDAGARAIAFDVIFTDQDAMTADAMDADSAATTRPQAASPGVKAFADSIHAFGDVLLPSAYEFVERSAADPAFDAMVAALESDPEATLEELAPRLRHGELEKMPLERFSRRFIEAREQAVLERLLGREFDGVSMDQIRARLAPRSSALAGSPVLSVLKREYELAQGIRVLQSRGRVPTAGMPPILEAVIVKPPLAPLAKSARLSGFVDYVASDGVVRTVPLWVKYRGRLYPQIGFALACAMMGVDVNDPEQVEIVRDRMIVHPAVGDPIVVPMNVEPSSYGAYAAINIPWVGQGWEGLFGLDENHRPKHHISVNLIYDIRRARSAIIANNRNADDAIRDLLGYDMQALNEYTNHLPPREDVDARVHKIDFLLGDAKDQIDNDREGLKDLGNGEADQAKKRELSRQIAAYEAFPTLRRESVRLAAQYVSLTGQLRAAVRGRAVLFGSVSTAAADFVTTSIGPEFPGVVAHGTIYNAFMTRRLLRRSAPPVGLLLTITFGLLTVWIVTYLSPWPAIASTFLIAVGYLLANGLVMYDRHYTIVPVAGPLTAIAVVWSGSNLFRYIVERAEKARITRRLSGYVDPGLLQYVLDHPEKARLEGEQKEVTIVFTDLKGFTALTETLGEGAVSVLGEYMGEMVPCVPFSTGYVNKFIGDGIMCLFGVLEQDQDHAANAVVSVLKMNEALDRFNRRLAERNLPALGMRAGINTGRVFVGDAGPRERTDYTALGDAVNLAARLESANKAVGCRILIGARTAELLKGRYLLRPVALLRVVGKQATVMTYEPLALVGEATDAQRRLVDCTQQVVAEFQAGRFDECLKALDQAEAAAGENELFDLYRELCAKFRRNRPPDFVGQVVLDEK